MGVSHKKRALDVTLTYNVISRRALATVAI